MKIKTSELTGAALDWAVAKVSSLEVYFDDGVVCLKGQPFDGNSHYWLPTQNWDQGGPIIEEKEIELHVIPAGRDPANWVGALDRDTWAANICVPDADYVRMFGPTPLIAAMRTCVASKLGDEVEVPDDLT